MAQHDYVIANASGATVRADINSMALAISSNNSGSSAPSTTYAYQLWLDTGNSLLKLRNAANNAWITMPLSVTADNTVDINGGTIDGTNIGASSAGTGAFTTLSASSTLGVTGVLTANAGVKVDNITIDGTEIDLSSGDLTLDVAGNIVLDTDGGEVKFDDGGTRFANLYKSSNNFVISSAISDGDILLKGNDNGSTITALTLDMSAAGSATFNHDVILGDNGQAIFGAGHDLGIYHDGSDSYIKDTGSGNLLIQYSDLYFSKDAGSTHSVVFRSTGDVGIGTSSPADYNAAADNLVVASSGDTGISIVAGTSNDSTLMFADGTGGTSGYRGRVAYDHNTDSMVLHTGAAERVRITSVGDVGIGTDSTTAKLHVKEADNNTESDAHVRIEGSGYSAYHFLDGTAYYIGQNSGSRALRIYSQAETAGVNLAAGGTSWGTFSDERLKENIQDIGSVIDKIKDIRCVSFNRTDIEDSKETIGFIAQDFIGKFDQALDKSKLKDDEEEEYYSIKYTETIPVLLKAIQEQQTIIEDLKTRIETLEGE